MQTRDPSSGTPQRSDAAFSLIELLVVVAIISVLAAVGANSLLSSSGANRLLTTGNNLVNLAYLARQEAISRNTPSALVLLTNAPTGEETNNYRAFSVLLWRNDQWEPISRWEILPSGIEMSTNTSKSTFLKNAGFPSVSPQATSVGSFRGKLIAPQDCAVRVFLPTGGLWNSLDATTIRLRLVKRSDDDSNYYDVALIGPTGIAKVERDISP